MIRAERGGLLFDTFEERGMVAIGWADVGSLVELRDRDVISQKVREHWPEYTRMQVSIAAGQLHRFRNELQIGDRVVTYNPARRVYLLGTIRSDYRYDPGFEAGNPNVRQVEWEGEVPRDALSTASRNSLGAITALFLLPERVASEMEAVLQQNGAAVEIEEVEQEEEETSIYEDIQDKAVEFTKDRISSLNWTQLQDLVAGLLRAMGYKTRVSPSGPDRGKDIVASPDGFGFEDPRIVVEVKHRSAQMSSQDIRSFLGGRHQNDKGLYVSTGGFTKDAYYEAERASIPLTLMNIDDLVAAVIEHYESMDIETKAILPLRRIFWPLPSAS